MDTISAPAATVVVVSSASPVMEEAPEWLVITASNATVALEVEPNAAITAMEME